MRTAPPVVVALQDARLERCLVVLLVTVAGAHAAAWCFQLAADGLDSLPFGPWSVAVAGAMAGAAAGSMVGAMLGVRLARRLLPAAPGELRWDGQAWWWREGRAPSDSDWHACAGMRCILDGGRRLWLRSDGLGRGSTPPWMVAVDDGTDPAAHLALRRALLAAPARAGAGQPAAR